MKTRVSEGIIEKKRRTEKARGESVFRRCRVFTKLRHYDDIIETNGLKTVQLGQRGTSLHLAHFL